MKNDSPRLPESSHDLALVVDEHAKRERIRCAPQNAIYKLLSLFQEGYRKFERFDTQKGIVKANPNIFNDGKTRRFQSQELLKITNDVVGRLASLDLMPAVGRNGDALSSIRDRAMSQLILDSVTDQKSLEEKQEDFAYLFAWLGGCGIMSNVQDHPSIGLHSDPEVVHPRELYPWPSVGPDYTKARGIMRERYWTMEALRDKFGRAADSPKNRAKMEYYEVAIGDVIDHGLDQMTYDPSGSMGGFSEQPGRDRTRDKRRVELVLVRELWTYGPNGTVEQTAITSGIKLFHRQDFTGDEVYCPIQYARFLNNGTWHGAGLGFLLYSLHREYEELFQRLFENVVMSDDYEVPILPATAVNQKVTTQKTDKFTILTYHKDPLEAEARPFKISPSKMNEVPGRIAAHAKAALQQLSPVDDLIRDKGRIDSADAMEILQEESQRKLTSSLRGIDRCFGAHHRATLASALRLLVKAPRRIHMTRVSPDLAGVIFDEDGFAQLGARNSIPRISHLQFSGRSVRPVSAANQKRAALEMFTVTGRTDITGLKLHAIRKGFELDMDMELEKSAYESVVWDILRLYNDGEESQEIVVTPYSAYPELQIRVLQAFMASIVFRKASLNVQNDFAAYYKTLLGYSNTIVPAAMNPEDFALLAANRETQRPPSQGVPS